MKKILILLYLSLLFAVTARGQQQKNDFRWLTGSWKINTGNGFITETWEKINDSLYRGKSMMVKGKDSTLQETIELLKRDTSWYYVPTAAGQNNNKPVSFTIIFQRFGEFICVNPEHDFPQRIAYRRFLPTQMHASIEGNNRGRYSKQNFNFYLEDNSELFSYTITPMPSNTGKNADTTVSSVFKRHVKFLDSMGLRGSVIFGGHTAFENNDSKMTTVAVIKAADREKASTLIAADPAIVSGLFKGELLPFRLNNWYPGNLGR